MPRNTAADRRVPWWAWVLAVDVVFIILILFGDYWPRTPVTRAVLSWFAIQQEMNLAAWWSAAQLLLGAFLMYERASIGSPGERWAWATLAFASAGLSFDEIGSLHERLAGQSWRPLLLPAVPLVVAVVWALVRLARNPARRREIILVVLAYGLFAGAAGLEYLESGVKWHAPEFMGQELEEGTELVGFLLLLFAAAGHRRAGGSDLRALIPDPGRMPFLRGVLVLGLLPYAVFALLVSPGLADLYRRGDPVVGYPFMVYGLLACQAFTVGRRVVERDRRAWSWLAGFFLVCSIGAVFPITNLAPYIDYVVPRWVYAGTYATHLFVVLPVLFLAGRVLGWRHSALRRLIAILAVLVLVRLPGRIWWLDAMTPGLVAYLWTRLFIGPVVPRPEPSPHRPSERPLPA